MRIINSVLKKRKPAHIPGALTFLMAAITSLFSSTMETLCASTQHGRRAKLQGRNYASGLGTRVGGSSEATEPPSEWCPGIPLKRCGVTCTSLPVEGGLIPDRRMHTIGWGYFQVESRLSLYLKPHTRPVSWCQIQALTNAPGHVDLAYRNF